ncbi:hypothetical protein Q5P01_009825 [Channa striata]|uniref:Uncharacterized protein n=1 Tax=Channa striata TaxID=64152 RepID=A0AA88N1J1_CHASR|nr:hypothetical protein Q5P01_009825 [Channa striata]
MLQPRGRKIEKLRLQRLKLERKYYIYTMRRQFSRLRYELAESCEQCSMNFEKTMLFLANNPQIQTEPKAGNNRILLLQTRLERCKMQIKTLTEENGRLQEDAERRQKNELHLHQALEDARSRYDEALSQKQLEREESLSHMKENYENILKQQKEKKVGFTKAMQWVHEILTQFIKLQLKMAEDDKARLQKSVNELEMTVLNQARAIEDLQIQLGESDVVELKKRVEQLEELNVMKNLELIVAKRAEKGMFSDWCEEKENHAKTALKLNELMQVNNRVQNEMKETKTKLCDKVKELQKSKQANQDLSEINAHLKRTLQAINLDNINLKTKVKEFEIFRLSVKKDLQRCVSAIREPKTLASRVLALKERYVDTGKKEKTDEEHQTDRVKKRTRELTKKPNQLLKGNDPVDQTRRFLIKLVNAKIMEVHKLNKELKKVNLQLQKATKPAPQKIKRWIDKKLCRATQVTPEITDEAPVLYPEDWQPLI